MEIIVMGRHYLNRTALVERCSWLSWNMATAAPGEVAAMRAALGWDA